MSPVSVWHVYAWTDGYLHGVCLLKGSQQENSLKGQRSTSTVMITAAAGLDVYSSRHDLDEA